MKRLLLTLAALGALTTATAHAEVIDATAGGFEVRRTVVINAPADRVYAALAQPSQWWSKDHTWSGSAANL